ncbi:phosphate/phosphite/phosphonate ABC transporter substrate-binding protein [Desulfovibrio sp. JC010]|uniref:phosphate/phosphite/phosphonate ABC transporter substrate-binding protein n=1 Tax=Desulfovibrio sp. JC010 TaxID=2593641 RepID=UPI0013D80CFC|nr:phosphate/phosphite/phosphonate ABC transporter substrate-binding protein [Desulfovibrio sp. JC010]NDV25616.1 phosphate/phosphite/phosphonate ABC transporter substrate-binding protein [Desulfovibrio sp. JC010]
MKKVLCMLTALLLSFSLALPAQANGKITIGLIPWSKPKVMYNSYKDIASYLGKELGMEVSIVITKDYDDLVNRMNMGMVDVGRFSSSLYVQTKDKMKDLTYLATAVNRDGQGGVRDFYQGVILSRKDSGIKNLADAKGKKFAFTDPGSSSGYVYPKMLLEEKGINPDSYFSKVFFLKKHDKVIDALRKKSIDLGATYDELLWLKQKEFGDIFTVVAETPEIPYGCFAAAPGLKPELTAKLKKALASYKVEKEDWDKVFEEAPIGFSVRDDAFYNPVREARKFK